MTSGAAEGSDAVRVQFKGRSGMTVELLLRERGGSERGTRRTPLRRIGGAKELSKRTTMMRILKLGRLELSDADQTLRKAFLVLRGKTLSGFSFGGCCVVVAGRVEG